MSDELELAAKEPWWSKAPAYLAISIVGVPSLIAILGGVFIAKNVTKGLDVLTTYNVSELHLLNEQNKETERSFEVIERYMADDLKAQYQTCIESAKSAQDRARCIAPEARMERYGIEVADPKGE